MRRPLEQTPNMISTPSESWRQHTPKPEACQGLMHKLGKQTNAYYIWQIICIIRIKQAGGEWNQAYTTIFFATKVKGHQLAKATVISCEMMDEAQNDYFHNSGEEQVKPIMVFLEGSAGWNQTRPLNFNYTMAETSNHAQVETSHTHTHTRARTPLTSPSDEVKHS